MLVIKCVTSRTLPPVATDNRGDAVVTKTVTALISSGQRKVTPRASVSRCVPGREAGSGPRPKADRASAPEGHQGRSAEAEFGFVLNSSK